ncbi:MAG TPA: alpha-L-rhamnosidase C-terminal domain-containing protein, partial [Pedococcus sp.]|nr:alpha-L-rhamnosidase C-terminal domain-containing protein [Pedococcus sp.]
FNHYALGAVADWMHRAIGGIAPAAPGYAQVVIAPQPGGGLTWAKAALDSPHGRIAADWRLEGGTFSLQVDVPEGVSATVRLPRGGPTHDVGAGSHTFSS